MDLNFFAPSIVDVIEVSHAVNGRRRPEKRRALQCQPGRLENEGEEIDVLSISIDQVSCLPASPPPTMSTSD